MSQKISTYARYIVIATWVCSILGIGMYGYIYPAFFTAEGIRTFLQSFGTYILVGYFAISMVRGLTLSPSLPLVVAGVLLFPESPLLVYIISMLGIVFSGIIVYFFADVLGLGQVLRGNRTYEKVHTLLEKYGIYIITLWSFLPFVPTDLMCYAAGSMRIRFWKFLLGLTLGESVIVYIIVYMPDIFRQFF